MKHLTLAGFLALASLTMTGCTNTPTTPTVDLSNTVEAGDVVKVDYIGSETANGAIFDTSLEDVAKANGDLYNEARPYEPLEFPVGAGQMIPGFDAGVVGMEVGETKKISFGPDQGYGERTDEAIQEIPSQPFIDAGIDPVVGESYNFGFAQGTVLEVGSGSITVDLNHFLAGKDLTFEVTVREVVKGGAANPADEAVVPTQQ